MWPCCGFLLVRFVCVIRRGAEGAAFAGVVVYPLIRDSQEVLIGLTRDPQLGRLLRSGWAGFTPKCWPMSPYGWLRSITG